VTWQPSIGEPVQVAASGRVGTVVHITLTEWGFLYDVEHIGPGEEAAETTRRTYAAGELTPAERAGE
jgi:hypothetical protein